MPSGAIWTHLETSGAIIIDEYAIIGAGSLFHQFTKLGCDSMIAGGAIVRKDNPPYSIAGNEPLNYRGVNSIGLKRRNFSIEQINQIQNIYRIIYLEGRNNSQAIEKIESDIKDSIEKKIVLNFIKNSERGIIKGILD